MSSKERCEEKKKKQSSVLRLRTFTTSTTTSRGCTSYLFADYLFDVDTVSSIVCVFDVDTVPSIVCVFGVDSVPYYSRPRPVLMLCLKDAWTVRGAEDARPARHTYSFFSRFSCRIPSYENVLSPKKKKYASSSYHLFLIINLVNWSSSR